MGGLPDRRSKLGDRGDPAARAGDGRGGRHGQPRREGSRPPVRFEFVAVEARMSDASARSRIVGLGTIALVWSFVPFADLAVRAQRSAAVLTGADGYFAGDQLQYMMWIRDAAAHGASGDLFDVTPHGRVFTTPVVPGGAVLFPAPRSIQFAYLVWKPIAVAALLAGAVLYTRRLLGERGSSWL